MIVLVGEVVEVGSTELDCEEEEEELVVVEVEIGGVGDGVVDLPDEPTEFMSFARTNDLSLIIFKMASHGRLLLSLEIANDLLSSLGLSRSK